MIPNTVCAFIYDTFIIKRLWIIAECPRNLSGYGLIMTANMADNIIHILHTTYKVTKCRRLVAALNYNVEILRKYRQNSVVSHTPPEISYLVIR